MKLPIYCSKEFGYEHDTNSTAILVDTGRTDEKIRYVNSVSLLRQTEADFDPIIHSEVDDSFRTETIVG